MALLFEDKIPSKVDKEVFTEKVKEVSDSLEIDPNWLMAVMQMESGLDPQAVNPYSDATGLIQFMPKTAQDLGTSIDELRDMSAIEQLDYVKKYLQPYSHKMLKFRDVYMAVFFPAAMSSPPYETIKTDKKSASKVAQQNKVFDINKDNKITVGEFEKAILEKIPPGWKGKFTKSMDTAGKFAQRNWVKFAGFGLIGISLGYLILKRV